ncbi:MAG: AsmA family protein [Chlamydiales bacterium]
MRITTSLLILLLILVVVGFFAWGRVATMLSNHLTKELGVKTSIDSLILGPRTIVVKDLVIGNVANGTLPKSFSAQEIGVKAPVTRYFNQDIVIEEIHVDNIYLGLEFATAKGVEGNWTEIMKNLQPAATATGTTEKVEKRTLLIKKIKMTKINTDLVYLDAGNVRHLPQIDYMEFTNISSEGGLPLDQLLNSVLGQMLQKVFIQQNLKNMIQDIWNTPGGVPEKLQKLVPDSVKRFLPMKYNHTSEKEVCA